MIVLLCRTIILSQWWGPSLHHTSPWARMVSQKVVTRVRASLWVLQQLNCLSYSWIYAKRLVNKGKY